MKDKLIYDGWLKLYHREVNNKNYVIIKNYDAVSAAIVNELNEILLVKQFRPSVMEYTLEIPAGCIDVPEESIENCLVREIKEETNITITVKDLKKLVSYKPMMGFSNSTMHLFKVTVEKSALKSNKIDDTDVTEAIWMPFKEFERNIQSGIIYDSKTIISYLYLKANL